MDPAQALEAREIARYRVINETAARGDSAVQQFYAGAVVLVTGGSGFLGKQLIEKLLRSCKVKKIFILLRTKKQKTIEERISKLLDDPVYEYLHEIQPDFVDKIVAVPGDVTQPHLDISERDWSIITEEVNIIFHGAATISFIEPLKNATLTNVRGTREMMLLAMECKNLRSYVHISTAYSHAIPERSAGPVLEQFYDSPISPNALIEMAETMDEHVLDDMTPQLIKGWPNTYAFTKAVAEEEVRTMAGNLPVCIVRPAIVICACREPLPGWLDRSCVLGPTGFVVGSGIGILHVIYANNRTNLDLVPVDLVNNATIAAAHDTTVRRDRGDGDVKIYTVTSTRNPIQFGKMVEVISTQGRQISTTMAVWYGFAVVISNRTMYLLLSFLLHSIPGYLVDGLLLLFGKKPILTKIYSKVVKLNDVLGYYMTSTWIFGDSNLRQLYWSLSPADRTIFDCNIDSLDWTQYIVLWCIGARKYIMKDGLKDTEKGVRKQFWLKIINLIAMVIYIYAIYKVGLMFVAVISYFFGLLMLVVSNSWIAGDKTVMVPLLSEDY